MLLGYLMEPTDDILIPCECTMEDYINRRIKGSSIYVSPDGTPNLHMDQTDICRNYAVRILDGGSAEVYPTEVELFMFSCMLPGVRICVGQVFQGNEYEECDKGFELLDVMGSIEDENGI